MAVGMLVSGSIYRASQKNWNTSDFSNFIENHQARNLLNCMVMKVYMLGVTYKTTGLFGHLCGEGGNRM